ncbi:hypothetical protein HK104_010375 [Borealophlyctis nickersoniae]|nr:hypothetical protein HK104_010375 [Borealophlyctis nickersoniae]
MSNQGRSFITAEIVQDTSSDNKKAGARPRGGTPSVAAATPSCEVVEVEETKSKTDNLYIFAGYRRIQNSYIGCFKSLLYIHNETGNIFSHLIGALTFLVLALASHTFAMDVKESTRWPDYVVMTIFILSAVICLGLSTMFHTCCCHSQKVAHIWNKIDYVGIVILTVGSFIPSLYYGFYCSPTLQVIYSTGISVLGLVTCPTKIMLCLSRTFSRPEYRLVRTLNFVALGLSGIVPVVHAAVIYGVRFMVDSLAAEYVLAMGALYALGAVIYATRVPEKFYPGKFDIWGHSHQIFHVLVLSAALTHYVGVIKAYRFWHSSNPYCSVPMDYMLNGVHLAVA